MEFLTLVKGESVKSEMEYEDESMDVQETPSCGYCEEGEINFSDEDKSVEMQIPSNVSNMFVKHNRENQTKGLDTGFHIFDESETQRKLDRAKRFSLPVRTGKLEEVQKEKLSNLYRDLGIDQENERHYRFNAVHMRGTENMSTHDVLQYFFSYGPSYVEWINDVSCNVIWMDDVSAAVALLNLSKKIKNLDKVHLNADPFEKEFKEDSPCEEINEEAVDAREIKTAIPPGFWRIGVPCEKSSFLLLRYANKSDRKQRNAERISEYYKRYGNPHYGNIPGLISNSLRTGRKKSRVVSVNKDSGKMFGQLPEKKNPWEELAYEWGKTDKVEKADKNFLRSNIVEREPKVPDLRISLKNKFKGMRRDSVSNSNSSDKETWESRSKIPRMKMYADDEEKRLSRGLEKRFQGSHVKRQPEDLRSKINKKKTETWSKFRSERRDTLEYDAESSNSENEYSDGDSVDWALEHYRDLRESLKNNRKCERPENDNVLYDSNSEDDELFKKDFSCRSPLKIEIENDEYYSKKSL